ncbi:MAG: iron(III) transport system substrate-binding protein [Chloroflexota bacterium]|nr:iron(III) transport system substrate-binding protein [Chloroflexota bacterium]
MRHSVIFIIGVLVLSLMLGACSSQAAAEPAQPADTAAEAAVVEEPAAEAAPVSGPLTVLCGPQEDWCQAMTAAFQDQTGIETSYVRLSSGEAVARLEAEADAPTFDVWWGGPSDGQVEAFTKGLIEPFTPANAAEIPDALKDEASGWTGIYVGALGFCSNQDVLDELGVAAPTSWDDLLDPKLAGNIAIADSRTSGTAYTSLYTLVLLRGEDGAFDYLKQLDSNIFQYTKSGSAPGTMAASGEVAVAIIFSHDCVKFREETGANLVVSFPAEGTGYEIGAEALIKNAPNPEAAKVWMDWALTPEAQAIAATVKSYQVPTNPATVVPAKAISLSQVTLVDYDSVAAGEAKSALIERYAEEVREGAAAPES